MVLFAVAVMLSIVVCGGMMFVAVGWCRSPVATGSADDGFGDGINLFGVEQQVVLLEQPRHAGAMERQLERAEAERAEDYLAVLGQTAIVLPHTFDARRGRGVCIGYQFQRGAVLPLFFVQQSNAGGACPEHYLRLLDGRAALDMGGRFYGLYHHPEAR